MGVANPKAEAAKYGLAPPAERHKTTDDVAVQIRCSLSVLKRQGVPWPVAWEFALSQCRWPHHTPFRKDAKKLAHEMAGTWERAYTNSGEIRGGRILLSLAERLGDGPDIDREPVRVPPVLFTTPPDPHRRR